MSHTGRTVLVIAAAASAALAAGWLLTGNDMPPPAPRGSATGQASASGVELFGQYCAVCHGANLRGTQSGPSLLERVYIPNFHPDDAFYVAALIGVRQHHWQFGSMPAVAGVSRDDVTAIIAYVRGRQRDAGLY
jgi:mono/diheme cytochrome c family protein